MSDPGLTNRLRQRSRRAGLAVGLSMALTIAVCIGSFAWIYAKADPLFADLVGNDLTTPTRAATASVAATAARGSANDEPEPTEEPTEESEPEPTEEPTPAPTETPDVFQASHVSNPDLQINLRPEPSTNGDPVAVLATGTPLQYLGEEDTGDDGFQWFRFRTEDGVEGWLREGTFQEI
jgi:hypothetical protein